MIRKLTKFILMIKKNGKIVISQQRKLLNHILKMINQESS